MTTLAPPPEAAAAPAPAPRPQPVEPVVRYPTIRAHLLPDEVIASRHLTELKKRIGIGLAALLALLVLGYGVSWWQTSSARGDLSDAQHATTQLQAQQKKFAPLLSSQRQLATIQTALTQLMVGDLAWPQLLAELNQAAPGGVTLTSISASMSSGAAGAAAPAQAGIAVLNQTGQRSVGTLSLSGTAPDQQSVAAFVDSLAKVKGLAAPFPASVGSQGGGAVQFSVNVLITTDALGGRYSVAAPGGK